jgi:SagB-type dehydrogenase family enzyme
MPDPFRHYEGVPVIDLPADPPSPAIPALDVLQDKPGRSPAADGPAFLSQLLYYSAAISASKCVPSTGERYALRVNPSSGNLHPTEFHFVTHGLTGWPDGLYHYRPSSHMAEQRALGDIDLNLAARAPIVFVLSSIVWREAWKYRERAYRYCLHDMGHAWQALTLAAKALGCDVFATGEFPDDELARLCRLNDDEWPLLVLDLRGNTIPLGEQIAAETVWFGGHANSLSNDVIRYPLIEDFHAATKTRAGDCPVVNPPRMGLGPIKLPSPATSARPFGEVVRKRRSALDFTGGDRSMSWTQLAAVLRTAVQPLQADFASTRFIKLYLYVHRIDGLTPGVYRLWEEHAELEPISYGDQRVAAAGLSLAQDLAGNACVAFSMIADIERAVSTFGDRGYRYVHFEAGAIGHRLYLAAEALGLGATGIGAFYDDEVHRYLGIAANEGQVVYHFAIGYPVFDPRLNA